MTNSRVSIIGCGNIGISLLQGLLKDATIPAGNIIVTKRNIGDLAYLTESGVMLTSDNVEAVKDAHLVIIAVKPYNITGVLEELKPHLNPE
jgi:pyrroline-5-carboxylate reductase